ncbi:MAG: hypothetical protein ABW098_04500 [Candidatus Thiodiazotropha sp.]
MGKQPAITAVLLQSLPSMSWSIAGRAFGDRQRGRLARAAA